MVSSIPQGVNTIIFDLGGVIIDLAPVETAKAFAAKSGISVEDVYRAYAHHPEFIVYEKGGMDDQSFRNFIRKTFSSTATDQAIDHGWNAMLLGFPSAKQTLLENLKKKFKTIVLSNTNSIHIQFIEEKMLQGQRLDSFFHHAYYSHQVNMRKPETEIYSHVLTTCGIQANQTVFLDDNLDNLKAAEQLGIHTIHISHPDQVNDLFKNL
jgi:glucose-1-phosphatase